MRRTISAFLILVSCDFTAFAKWIVETVDNTASDAGAYCSLAVIDGQPAISYQYDGYLWYARYNGSGWDYANPNEEDWAVVTSLKALPDGNAVIAYHDHDSDDLKYAWFNGSIWQDTIVESTGNTGNFPSLAIVGEQPAISYIDYTPDPDVVKYARFNGTTWDITSITPITVTGASYTSMVVLPDGKPAIAYCDNSALRYARYDGTTWLLTTISTVSTDSGYASMAVLPDGNPAITFYNAGSKSLKYAYYNGSVWTVEEIYKDAYTATEAGLYSHLAILPNGKPAVSWYWLYSSLAMGRLQFSWQENGRWHTTEIDGGYYNRAGLYSSLEVMADNSLGIAYYDYDSDYGKLKFARSQTPITAANANFSYIAAAWLERAGEMVGIDEPVYNQQYIGGDESCMVSSSVRLENTMPSYYVGQITVNGQACIDGECREYDPNTGECLLWGKCLAWDEETGDCIEWGQAITEDPNDASGRLEAQIELLPSAAMPLGSATHLNVSFALNGYDVGASETMYCRIYRNGELATEFVSDTISAVDANVGDIIDVNIYLFVESDSSYYRQLDITLYVSETAQHAPLYSDICGETTGPDGCVNFLDFVCLAARWLETDCSVDNWCNRADIDMDDNVDFDELKIMADEWLRSIY